MGEEAMEGTDCRAKILSQDYRDFLIPGYREDVEVRLPEEKTCVQEGDFGLRVISADKEIVGDLSFEAYGYPAIPKCYALLDMDALNETGISTVQNYPALQLDGKGIMIGFVDTGIDYTNEIFRNPDGTTRIVGIWDQTLQEGEPPQDFSMAANTGRRGSMPPWPWIPRRPWCPPGMKTATGLFWPALPGEAG